MTRINKWGKAAKLVDFGANPLWHVNPQGAIATHQYTLNRNFWRFKSISYDLVCAVDGAWGLTPGGFYNGGIGGWIKDSNGLLLHTFSGPLISSSALEAEVGALWHIISVLLEGNFHSNNLVICSDSMDAMELLRTGSFICTSSICERNKYKKVVDKYFSLQFVPRSLNAEADELAKKGLSKLSMVNYWRPIDRFNQS